MVFWNVVYECDTVIDPTSSLAIVDVSALEVQEYKNRTISAF